MSKIMNLISLKNIHIYMNILMLYLVYIIVKSNWSSILNKEKKCNEKRINIQQDEFIDLENYHKDITQSAIDSSESQQFYYNINFDKQLEMVVKFILITFILLIAFIINNNL